MTLNDINERVAVVLFREGETAAIQLLVREMNGYASALAVIAGYGDESNEWDGRDRYEDVREIARVALGRGPCCLDVC